MLHRGLGACPSIPRLIAGLLVTTTERHNMTKIKSLFEFCDKAEELPPEPMPTKVVKLVRENGKFKHIAVERNKK